MPSTIVLKLNEMNGLADVLKVVQILGTQATLLPLLQGLDLSGNMGEGSGDDAIRTEEGYAQYEASVLHIVTVRKLVYLTLPRLSLECASRVMKHVNRLQESSPPCQLFWHCTDFSSR